MNRYKHVLIALSAVVLVSCGITYVAQAATRSASCTGGPITTTSTAQTFSVNCSVPRPPATTVTATATVTTTATVTASPTVSPSPTVTPSPSGSPSPTPTPTPTPTSTPTATPTSGGTYTCGPVPLGGGCPANNGYLDTGFSFNSNGYNTYVSNQDLGANGSQSLWANGPGDWKVLSNLSSCAGCVQTFPNAQQLYNDNNTADGTYPLSSFSALKVNYNETSPGGTANAYQFSPDIFFGNYPNDVMFWVDINGRCNEGAWGPSLLGHFTMPDGSGWTAHRYDGSSKTTGNTGAEIILVKDGPGGQGTCAQEPSGTVDVKAGLEWLAAGGFMPAVPSIYIVQTGWEITQSSNATFKVNSMSYTATLK